MESILKPKQQEVWDNVLSNPQYKRICLYGSSRSGKTFLAGDYNHERAIAYPGSFHLFVRSTLTALTTGVISQTFPDIFKAYKDKTGVNFEQAKNEQGIKLVQFVGQPYSRFEYYNGSEIRFLGLDKVTTNKAALDKILSQEYMTITIEEGPEMDFTVVEMLLTRLAQKVNHYITGNPGIPKLLVTLNPRLFEDWDYVWFHKKVHPIDGRPVRNPDMFIPIHFDLADNPGGVADEYAETLADMSAANQMRFKTGEHADSFDGEVFKKLFWDTPPQLSEFDGLIIYTDPSYKSGPKNDFKASVLVGRCRGAFWVLCVKAMQTTTAQMIHNVHNLDTWARGKGWTRHISIWFENAGMADDFQASVDTHAERNGWTCPFQLDGRDKGEKYVRVEQILEPLNRNGKLFFNIEMKGEPIGNLITVQFLSFKRHMLPTEHDDIPDAVHGAVTMLNVPQPKPGGTHLIKKFGGPTV